MQNNVLIYTEAFEQDRDSFYDANGLGRMVVGDDLQKSVWDDYIGRTAKNLSAFYGGSMGKFYNTTVQKFPGGTDLSPMN